MKNQKNALKTPSGAKASRRKSGGRTNRKYSEILLIIILGEFFLGGITDKAPVTYENLQNKKGINPGVLDRAVLKTGGGKGH